MQKICGSIKMILSYKGDERVETSLLKHFQVDLLTSQQTKLERDFC